MMSEPKLELYGGSALAAALSGHGVASNSVSDSDSDAEDERNGGTKRKRPMNVT